MIYSGGRMPLGALAADDDLQALDPYHVANILPAYLLAAGYRERALTSTRYSDGYYLQSHVSSYIRF